MISRSVCLGTYKLYLSAAGPDRSAGSAAVIILQDLNSSIASWAAVIRLLRQHIRVFSYDRAGFGKSDKSCAWPTAGALALELDHLLQKANIRPPLILIGHAWGAVVAREFLSTRKSDVVGLIFVEPMGEWTFEMLDWRPYLAWVNDADIEPLGATGVDRAHKLTALEWMDWIGQAATSSFKAQQEKEYQYLREQYDFQAQGLKQLSEQSLRYNQTQIRRHITLPLPATPLAIIKGNYGQELRCLYDAVIRKHGPNAHHTGFYNFLLNFDRIDEQLQIETLKLSTNSIIVQATKGGHNVQLIEPKLFVQALGWIFDQPPPTNVEIETEQ